ncbi:hypothetical protein ACIBCT_10570 [Streptosporangium sp. NPDC050855]|uniref:hypothetical protein n=1 Tax=Streptosporangium sp. NPDC050855 TaxID=3366194 RepID=UPI0037B54B8D
MAAAAEAALATYLDRCALATNTVTPYRRQALAYREWLLAWAAEHADAFVDLVGADSTELGVHQVANLGEEDLTVRVASPIESDQPTNRFAT